MVFSSVTFLVYFLPIAILCYYVAGARLKNLVLLVFSLFFYAWGEPVYIILMMVSIIFNYASGIILARFFENKNRKKLILFINVFVNLSLLGFFKYADFAISNINEIFKVGIEPLNLPLPIGISFYTFQAMSYVIDLARGKVKVQRNFVTFATYISLFPQLIAGPIVRFETVEEQLKTRVHSFELFSQGVIRFIFGIAKKILLANNIGQIWTFVNNQSDVSLSILSVWIAALAFSLQIYFDFSGYSDMAIGLGKMFGFEFEENFNYPYVSKSVTEFWRRWHISLGTWFKEYVYIPLGGNRCKLPRQIFNIMLVWALTGLWHGASWNFVIWGLFFGVFLVMEKLFIAKWLEVLSEFNVILATIIQRVYTCVVIAISWLIFSVEDSHRLITMLKDMFGFGNIHGVAPLPLYVNTDLYLLQSNVMVLFIGLLVASGLPTELYVNFKSKRLANAKEAIETYEMVGLLVLFILSFAFTVASTYNPFLYFRF